jgi:hypothetical protein
MSSPDRVQYLPYPRKNVLYVIRCISIRECLRRRLIRGLLFSKMEFCGLLFFESGNRQPALQRTDDSVACEYEYIPSVESTAMNSLNIGIGLTSLCAVLYDTDVHHWWIFSHWDMGAPVLKAVEARATEFPRCRRQAGLRNGCVEDPLLR